MKKCLFNLCWCCIGDFNTIIGAHEYHVSGQPAIIAIDDLQDWTNAHDLIDIPTHGAKFTWTNGRRGGSY